MQRGVVVPSVHAHAIHPVCTHTRLLWWAFGRRLHTSSQRRRCGVGIRILPTCLCARWKPVFCFSKKCTLVPVHLSGKLFSKVILREKMKCKLRWVSSSRQSKPDGPFGISFGNCANSDMLNGESILSESNAGKIQTGNRGKRD